MSVNWQNAWVGAAGVLLVGSELLTMGEAGVWAVSGLAHLSQSASLALYIGCGLASLWLTALFARMIYRAEPFFGSLPQPGETDVAYAVLPDPANDEVGGVSTSHLAAA